MLRDPALVSRIGAVPLWSDHNAQVYENFAATGDFMRTTNPQLRAVIDAGVRVLLLTGEAVSLTLMIFSTLKVVLV